jgi:hypothetical protein
MIAVQEVKVGSRTRQVYVRPFAWNLHAPTHMEWTLDGRLLVVERTAGKVKDATRGGDMAEVKPFAWGLAGPASMCVLPDGRFLVSETWGGSIRDISESGDARRREVICQGLRAPYSMVYDASREKLSVIAFNDSSKFLREDLIVDPNTGAHQSLVYGLPFLQPPGFEAIDPPEAWINGEYNEFYAGNCDTWKVITKNPSLSYSSLILTANYILGVPAKGGPFAYQELLQKHLIASGLGYTGGATPHPIQTDLLCVTQPLEGSVTFVDLTLSRDYRFEPPVVKGLPMVSCVRFDASGEKMFACSIVAGTIWLVEGILKP